MEYISESTTMSKAMEEYGDRKSCAITTAKRLALFLGEGRRLDGGDGRWHNTALCWLDQRGMLHLYNRLAAAGPSLAFSSAAPRTVWITPRQVSAHLAFM